MLSNYLKTMLLLVAVLFFQAAISAKITFVDSEKEYVFKIKVFNKTTNEELTERLYVRTFYDMKEAIAEKKFINHISESFPPDSISEYMLKSLKEGKWRRTSFSGEYRINADMQIKAVLFVTVDEYANELVEIKKERYEYSSKIVVNRLDGIEVEGSVPDDWHNETHCVYHSFDSYLPYSFSVNEINEKHLIKVETYVMDSKTDTVIYKSPIVYFEGEAYKQKRMRKGIVYPDSVKVKEIAPVKDETLEILIPYYCIIRPIPVQFPEVLQGTGEA